MRRRGFLTRLVAGVAAWLGFAPAPPEYVVGEGFTYKAERKPDAGAA